LSYLQQDVAVVELIHPLRYTFTSLPLCNGVGTNFGVGVGEARPEGPRAGDGVLWEATASPSPPTRGFAGAL